MENKRVSGFVLVKDVFGSKVIWKVRVQDPTCKFDGKNFQVKDVRVGTTLREQLNVTFLLGNFTSKHITMAYEVETSLETEKPMDWPNVFTRAMSQKYHYTKNERGRFETNIDGIDFEFDCIGSVFAAVRTRYGWIERGQLVEGSEDYGSGRGIGIVTNIFRPNFQGWGSQVIQVHFEGDSQPTQMKLKEIRPTKKQ